MRQLEPPTGHVFRRDRVRRATWYAKCRLPDGRPVQKRIGPAWTERGRPPAGYFTKRTAEDWLRGVLDEARRGTLPGLVRTGATCRRGSRVLRYVEHDRAIKPSTLTDYRSIVAAHPRTDWRLVRKSVRTSARRRRRRRRAGRRRRSSIARRTGGAAPYRT